MNPIFSRLRATSTQEVALTDLKGATAFVQKCLDKAGLNAKAVAQKADNFIRVKGKAVGGQTYAFAVLKDDAGYAFIDVYAMPYTDTDIRLDVFDALQVDNLKSVRELIRMTKTFNQLQDELSDVIDTLMMQKEFASKMHRFMDLLANGHE